MSAICAVTEAIRSDSTHAAEISGWDVNGHFFTEVVELDTAESGRSYARLTHRLAHHSLVFVRPILAQIADDCERGLPVANEVAATDEPDGDGRALVRFLPCRPRLARCHGDRKPTTRI